MRYALLAVGLFVLLGVLAKPEKKRITAIEAAGRVC